MKNKEIILANISGLDRKSMMKQKEEKLITPASALSAMVVYLELYKESQKKKQMKEINKRKRPGKLWDLQKEEDIIDKQEPEPEEL